MPKEKYFLNLYNKSLKMGRLPSNGLCNCLDLNYEHNEVFDLLKPAYDSCGYWGYGGRSDDSMIRAYKFTPLRQTILLFCAAINNEL